MVVVVHLSGLYYLPKLLSLAHIHTHTHSHTQAFTLRRGWFFPSLIDDTDKFVYRQPNLKKWLTRVRDSGVGI